MRIPESDIKAAILHPEEGVRLTALCYFVDPVRSDESQLSEAIMPVVIEAIEKYGRDSAFGLLRAADGLPQTESTVDWLLEELQARFDRTDTGQDNYRFAICLLLLQAPFPVLADRYRDIAACSNFASELKPALDELVQMASWDWNRGWRAFTDFAREVRGRSMSANDSRRLARLMRCLSSLHSDGAAQVLDILKGRYRGNDMSLMQWADSWLVELAGHMRIREAVPLIMDRISESDEFIIDECGAALARIGGDEVVREIAEEWWDAADDFRETVPYVLEHIHTDLSAATCRELLEAEDDLDVALMLGHAVLGNFVHDRLDAVRELVVGSDDELHPDQWDLRYRLVAVATISEQRFPEYEAWHADAIATKYGWGAHERTRISENFRVEVEAPLQPSPLPDMPPLVSRKKTGRNDPCPCGSGRKYKKCCIDKGIDWEEDDLIFPDIGHPEHFEHGMVEIMKAAGIDPAKIHAFEKTGRLVSEDNQSLLTDDELAEWEAAVEEYESESDSGEPEYPIGTVALYGPDDRTTTKIVAAVIAGPDSEPLLERFVGSDVAENPKCQQAIADFFDRLGVKSVAASEGNIGCPHEEGEDFPAGGDCPFCPFWKGKQGSGAAW